MRKPLSHLPTTPSGWDKLHRLQLQNAAERYRSKPRTGLPAPLFPGSPKMRKPIRSQTDRDQPDAAKSMPTPPAAGPIALNRLGYGPAAGDLASFNALGVDDPQRLSTWLDQQLDPASIDDSAAEARIAQAGFQTLGKSLEQLWQDHILDAEEWETVEQPFRETTYATWLRAIHSKRQLFELMAEFWHTHFSIFGYEYPRLAIWVAYDRDVIRANALGNFRQMLEAVAQAPPMLYYLDNVVNSLEDPNENYARELMELHTLGADSYLGSLPQNQVPTDGQGRPLGWVEDDVIGAARCLTGWTVADRDWDPDFGSTGTFLYHDPWHDHATKTVLGADLPANQPELQDGRDLLDLLAEHPSTARFIAGKMCRRLVGDFPPESLVEAAATTFSDNLGASDQLARVIRTIVLAPEFSSTFGDKVKRPFEIAVSGFRLASADLPFVVGDGATDWFNWEYYKTGQPLFSWHPPNGYPDTKFAWNTTSPRVMTWRLCNMMVQVTDDNDDTYLDPLSQTPAGVRSAQAIVDFWLGRAFGYAIADSEREELVDFMAQGHNPTFDLPLDTDIDTQDRLRALLALICMSPAFLWR